MKTVWQDFYRNVKLKILYKKIGWWGREGLLLFTYLVLLFASLWFALSLRFDFQVPADFWPRFWTSVVCALPLKIVLLFLFGQFRSLLTYFSVPDAKRIMGAMVLSGVAMFLGWYVVGGLYVIPRGAIVVDTVLSFLFLAGFRLGLRFYREEIISEEMPYENRAAKRRVAIIGAGSAGAALLRDIQSRGGLGMEVVCFLDDDRNKIGNRLHGKPILGPSRNLHELVDSLQLKKMILAMPSAKPAVIRRVVGIINELGLEHDILPSVDQLLNRKVTVEHLRHVSPEDLLGREPVRLDDVAIEGLIKGKVVLITGAGGSIGSELCRQVAAQNPATLVLVERSEPALFAIQQELKREFEWLNLHALAASVCNSSRMESIFATHRPELVFHAAAHKHVPLMEEQPVEAILNNSIGTLIVATAAQKNGCGRFVLVSTDKAVNPTNVMGASKRLAELVLNGLQNGGEGITRFCSVRFGNVLGSSGSVIPVFREQISRGGPVTVTHPDVTRYFMSIPEAVGLILQSATMADGGEVFVLDMGEPVRIQDLAYQMIELCGFVPNEDIKIRFVGLRPGEKLYEEPIHQGENITKTRHSMVSKLVNDLNAAKILEETREFASSGLYDKGSDELKAWLARFVHEYRIWKNE